MTVIIKFLFSSKGKELIYLLILTIFVFLSAKAMFHDGFFRTIDDITTTRIIYMEKELVRNNFVNNFPVRMSGELANNFSYPLYLFYAPLIYYMGAFIKILLPISHIVATKYIYVVPLIIGPYGFYFAARQKLNPESALIGSIFFTLFPYRGLNTYILGTVGQAWAISFIPYAMGGLFILQKNKQLGGIILSFSLFLIFVSHNLTSILFLGTVFLFSFIFLKKSKVVWLYILLSMGMAAFYLIPMIGYLKIIKVLYLDINSQYILSSLNPLRDMFRLVPYHQVSNGEGLIAQISGFVVIILLGGLFFFIFKKIKNAGEIYFWGVYGLLLYVLMFKPLTLFWQFTLPLTGILQFAWRLLAILSFILPLYIGYIYSNIKNVYLKIIFGLIVIIISLSFLSTFKPESYSYFYEYKVEGQCATTSWQDEFFPVWVNLCKSYNGPLETNTGSKLSVIEDNSLKVKADILIDDNTELFINKYYFPGWHVYIDGVESKVDYLFSESGIMKTQISAGIHRIDLIYKKTILMWTADVISLISFGVFIYLFKNIIFGIKQKRLKIK